MTVRIHCPHCRLSWMVMSGVEKLSNTCPRCRTTFMPTAVPQTAATASGRPAAPGAPAAPAPSPRPAPPPPPRNVPPLPSATPVPPPPNPAVARNTAPAPARHPELGYLMLLGAWLLGPGALAVMIAKPQDAGWMGTAVCGCIFFGGTTSAAWLLMRGRRLVAQHAADVLATDPRPPVLLLRSFADDELELERNDQGWIFRGYRTTFEEVLAEVCTWYGPVIAIGRPGETLPPLGAARLWVDHASWQQKVTTILRDCRVVVMIMGAIKGKDGLAWEVETVARLGLLGKFVLVVPPLKKEDEVERRWRSYQWLTGGRIPPHQGGEMTVTFDQVGNGNVSRASGRSRGSYKGRLHAVLRRLAGKPHLPFLARLARWVRMLALGIVVIVFIFIAMWWRAEENRKKNEENDRLKRELYPSFRDIQRTPPLDPDRFRPPEPWRQPDPFGHRDPWQTDPFLRDPLRPRQTDPFLRDPSPFRPPSTDPLLPRDSPDPFRPRQTDPLLPPDPNPPDPDR